MFDPIADWYKSSYALEDYPKRKHDGYVDEVFCEITRATEELNFYDTYTLVAEANAAAKIRMLKKIKNMYGSRSHSGHSESRQSIESFCNNAIRSTEEDAAAAGGDANANQSNNNTNNSGGGTDNNKQNDVAKKKVGFFKKIWEIIKKIWTGLSNFFYKIVDGVRNKFVNGIIKKAEELAGSKDAPIVDPKTIPNDLIPKLEEASQKAREGFVKNFKELVVNRQDLAKYKDSPVLQKADPSKLCPALDNVMKDLKDFGDDHGKMLNGIIVKVLQAKYVKIDEFIKTVKIGEAEKYFTTIDAAARRNIKKLVNGSNKAIKYFDMMMGENGAAAVDDPNVKATMQTMKFVTKSANMIQTTVQDVFKTLMNGVKLGIRLRKKAKGIKDEENPEQNKKPNDTGDNTEKDKNSFVVALPVTFKAGGDIGQNVSAVVEQLGTYSEAISAMIADLKASIKSKKSENNNNPQDSNTPAS